MSTSRTLPGIGGSVTAGAQIGYARTVSTTAASTTATIPIDASIPQIGEGTAYPSLSTAYTPVEAASLLEIEVTIPFVSRSAVGGVIGALFEGAAANAIAATDIVIAAGDYVLPMVLRTVVSAASTTARTYSFRFGLSPGGAGTAYLLSASGTNYFGASNVATMTVREIKQ